MTRDEILHMPAGRDLDALVFEKVFGQQIRKNDVIFWPGLDHMPNYSTDIAAAWEVAEKIAYLAWSTSELADWASALTLVHTSLKTEKHPDEYIASFDAVAEGDEWYEKDIDENRFPFTAHASTASLAICRAALLAVINP